MYKFILVTSEVYGHASASAIIASNDQEEQKFRNEFLLTDGKPNARLISKQSHGADTVIECYSELSYCSGDFSILTTAFHNLKDIKNITFGISTEIGSPQFPKHQISRKE